MVLCKYFLQGNCRYGPNCRFEHNYASKYYHSNAPPHSASATPAVTDEQLIQQVNSDVQSALRGGQWILSSYAPFKEKAAFPGIIDLSPEEARLFIYEAKATNNLEPAIAYMNELYKDARTKHEQLLHKNTNITRILRSLYNGENVASPFPNATQENSAFRNNNPASSVFRSAVQTSPFAQNNTPSIFSQNNAMPSIFATNNATPSIFAQNNAASNSDATKSIFAQANQTSFNTNQNGNAFAMQNHAANLNSQPNVFGPQTDSAAKSIFAQATQNVFTSQPPPVQSDPANLFTNASKSIFTQNQATPFPQSQPNVFQNPEPQNVFSTNQNTYQQASIGDTSVYSKMEDLSPDDLQAFKSEDFKMGFVPELPPPHSLCY